LVGVTPWQGDGLTGAGPF